MVEIVQMKSISVEIQSIINVDREVKASIKKSYSSISKPKPFMEYWPIVE